MVVSDHLESGISLHRTLRSPETNAVKHFATNSAQDHLVPQITSSELRDHQLGRAKDFSGKKLENWLFLLLLTLFYDQSKVILSTTNWHHLPTHKHKRHLAVFCCGWFSSTTFGKCGQTVKLKPISSLISVVILVSEILDLVSPKDFGMT